MRRNGYLIKYKQLIDLCQVYFRRNILSVDKATFVDYLGESLNGTIKE